MGIVPVAMGLFGISEVLLNLETEIKRDILTTKVKNLFPSLKDWADSIWPIIRGSVLGFFLGIIPGGGAVIASFASYAIEKKLVEASRGVRHRGPSRGWRARNRRTMQARAVLLFLS